MSMDEGEVRKAAAKLLVFGFQGASLNSHARRLISLGAGGIILFSRNFEDPQQVAKLCIDLKREANGRKLLIMVDQEGGDSSRFGPPFTPVPPARTIGLTRDPKAAASMAYILGRELRSVYVDMDLAPVLDVDTNPENPVIGKRSFGSSPEHVVEIGCSFIRGLQSEGVASCAKHFPGHGDTSVDSHLDLPFLPYGIDRLEAIEILPFAKAVESGVAAIMLAHIVVPSLRGVREEGEGRPATMSEGGVSYLRSKLRFNGLVMSDCLEMGAIEKHFPIETAAIEAVSAGVDMLLVCHTEDKQIRTIEALVSGVLDGVLPLRRLMEAGAYVDRINHTYTREPPKLEDDLHKSCLGIVGCKEHHDMVSNVLYQAAAVYEA